MSFLVKWVWSAEEKLVIYALSSAHEHALRLHVQGHELGIGRQSLDKLELLVTNQHRALHLLETAMSSGKLGLLETAVSNLETYGLGAKLRERGSDLFSKAERLIEEAKARRDTNQRLTDMLLHSLVEIGTLDEVEKALAAVDAHEAMVAQRGRAWRDALMVDDQDTDVKLEAYERVLGDEFEWEWWERLVFVEHAKGWAADAMDMIDLLEDLHQWCSSAALASDSADKDKAPNNMLDDASQEKLTDMGRALAEADDMGLREAILDEARLSYLGARQRQELRGRLHLRAQPTQEPMSYSRD